jgi:hypothetical protein
LAVLASVEVGATPYTLEPKPDNRVLAKVTDCIMRKTSRLARHLGLAVRSSGSTTNIFMVLGHLRAVSCEEGREERLQARQLFREYLARDRS